MMGDIQVRLRLQVILCREEVCDEWMTDPSLAVIFFFFRLFCCDQLCSPGRNQVNQSLDDM